MDTARVGQLHDDLVEFVGDVFGSLTRVGWQERAGQYLQGLMLDGRRKSIQPMAARLAGVHEQALNHFVTNSPWDVGPVRRRLAQRMDAAISPLAWAVDDTGWLKCGTASVGVARQYTGTAGKVTNCQIGVSLNLVTDTASVPANWRLFLPESWDPASVAVKPDVVARRVRAGIPAEVGHQEKWRLALAMLDEAAGWGLSVALLVADAGYGDCAQFRHEVTCRGVCYVVQVSSTVSVHPQAAVRTTAAYRGAGRRPGPRYQQPALSVKDLVRGIGCGQARTVTWRHGSRRRGGTRVAMRSRFVFTRVRPAGDFLLRVHRDGDLPAAWLIAEWPPGHSEPVKYWLSNLPPDTPHRTLVRWAKLRWRIEHDYRELKTGLGLDHYEGRTWTGWHHHVTLVSAAHAFLTLQRLDPKQTAPE